MPYRAGSRKSVKSFRAPGCGKTRTARNPGALSSRLSSPPCSRATAGTSERPSPAPGRDAARLQPHETLDRTARDPARGIPAPLIGDAKSGRGRPRGRLAMTDFAGSAGSGGAVLDRVVDQVGDRLAEQFAAAVNRQRSRRRPTSARCPFPPRAARKARPRSAAISAASKSVMPSRASPASARAIISSALKVRIRPSDSSIVDSSAAR